MKIIELTSFLLFVIISSSYCAHYGDLKKVVTNYGSPCNTKFLLCDESKKLFCSPETNMCECQKDGQPLKYSSAMGKCLPTSGKHKRAAEATDSPMGKTTKEPKSDSTKSEINSTQEPKLDFKTEIYCSNDTECHESIRGNLSKCSSKGIH